MLGNYVRIPRHIRDDYLAALEKSVRWGRLAEGPNLTAFEAEFATRHQAAGMVTCNSATSALQAALATCAASYQLIAFPANCFPSLVGTALTLGHQVTFADVHAETGTLTVEGLEALSAKGCPVPRVVVYLHLGGTIQPEIAAVAAWCQQRGILLIEDASHCPGATWQGKAAGHWGQLAIWSFYATKLLTTGEGGGLTARCTDLLERLRSYVNHGKAAGNPASFIKSGGSLRLSEMAACLGLAILRHLDELLAERAALVANYAGRLDGLLSLLNYPAEPTDTASWYKCLVQLPPGVKKLTLQRLLRERGIGLPSGCYDWLVTSQPFLRHCKDFVASQHLVQPGTFPGAEAFCNRHLAMPLWTQMQEAEVAEVCAALPQALKDAAAEDAS